MEEVEIYTLLDYHNALKKLELMKEAPKGTYGVLEISWLENAIREYEESHEGEIDSEFFE